MLDALLDMLIANKILLKAINNGVKLTLLSSMHKPANQMSGEASQLGIMSSTTLTVIQPTEWGLIKFLFNTSVR